MEKDQPTLFFEAQYCYRRKGLLIHATFFGAAALVTLWKTSDSFRQVNVSGIVIAALCLGLTSWLLVQFLSERKITTRIDSIGITCDGKHWPWDQVSWLAGHSRPDGIQLFFQLRGTMSFDRHIWAEKGLTDDEYADLLERLNTEVKNTFPHVQIG